MARNYRISNVWKLFCSLITICIFIWLFTFSQPPTKSDSYSDNTSYSCSDLLQTTISNIYATNSVKHKLYDEKARLCDKFQQIIKRKRTLVTDVFNNRYKMTRHSITMVTHMGSGKIDRLLALLDTWQGPMSVSVHVEEVHLSTAPYSLCVPSITGRHDLLLHLVLQEDESTFYPGNYLRNVALNETPTEYVFLTDIDLMPSVSLYNNLMEHTKSLPKGDQKKVLVVPAFEIDYVAVRLPLNKHELQILMSTNKARPFLEKIHKKGHLATNFTRWVNAIHPYKVAWEDGFEPYVVARREGLPSYYENIVGRFRDKISHLMHVAALGYSFEVLPTVFVVHVDHGRSTNWELFRCAMKEYNTYKKKLQSQYSEFAHITT